MANTVQAILTNQGHLTLAQSFGGPSGGFSWSFGQYFKIGVDGYVIVGGQEQPVTPDPTLLDLISATSGNFYYRQTFQPSDILFILPSTIQFRAFLDLPFANGNPALEPDTPPNEDGPKNSTTLEGMAPEFFEIGVFDLQDNMIAYGTFPEEVKLVTKTLNHLISINF
jgi:hypothetical protein